MEPVEEGCFTRLGAIATVIGVIVAVIGVAITWYYAQKRVEVAEIPRSAATPSPTPGLQPSPQPAETGAPPEGDTRKASEPPHSDPPVLPLELTLRDGEQRTVLGDQASVAAEFNQIGSEEFVTLRVGTADGESVPHAVLGAGARYPFSLAGSDYSVYVLSVDKAARTVRVRISRGSKSSEKKGQ
jgi:hypothetical protein